MLYKILTKPTDIYYISSLHHTFIRSRDKIETFIYIYIYITHSLALHCWQIRDQIILYFHHSILWPLLRIPFISHLISTCMKYHNHQGQTNVITCANKDWLSLQNMRQSHKIFGWDHCFMPLSFIGTPIQRTFIKYYVLGKRHMWSECRHWYRYTIRLWCWIHNHVSQMYD